MKERLLDMFSFDLRLLGIARILLGLIVIIDLIKRSFNLTTFYTDAGVFPRSVLLENDWFSWNYSIHMMTGTTFGQSLLFLFTGFCALMVLIGYRTKIFLLLTYLLIISLQIRNSQVSHGGDIIMKIILFCLNSSNYFHLCICRDTEKRICLVGRFSGTLCNALRHVCQSIYTNLKRVSFLNDHLNL